MGTCEQMNIIPACENKLLSECGAGHLVRPIGYWGQGEFAIVGTLRESTDRALLLFRETGPSFTTVNGPDQVSVIDYGREWFLDVDHCGPFEASIRRMYEASGCLICEKSRWLINVRQDDGRFAYQRAQFDLTNSQLIRISDELNNIAVFGKWTLYLGDKLQSRDTWRRIAAFEWQPPEGSSA